MIIRCDNCSVSLQLDEAKIPTGNFTVRCPRCQNLLRANRDMKGPGSATVQLLEANKAAPIVPNGVQEFAEKQSEFQINSAMRSLLSALQTGTTVFDANDEKAEKPRRVLLCLGDRKEEVAKLLTASGYRVYIAETSAQANERLREGKTELVIFSPDFAAESASRTWSTGALRSARRSPPVLSTLPATVRVGWSSRRNGRRPRPPRNRVVPRG